MKGELRRRVQNQHLWNDGSIPEQYKDSEEIRIQVVTLRAYLAEVATCRAFDEGIFDLKKLETRVDELLTTELSSTKEFVEVTDNFIRVGINCNLIDDKAVAQAFEMIGQLDSYERSTTIRIGQLVQVYENKSPQQKRTSKKVAPAPTNICRVLQELIPLS